MIVSKICTLEQDTQDTHTTSAVETPVKRTHIHASSRSAGTETSRCLSKQNNSYHAAGNWPLDTLMYHTNQVHFLNLNSLKINFNIILSSTPVSPKYSLALTLFGYRFVGICLMSFMLHALPISFLFIRSSLHVVKVANFESYHFVIFSFLPLLCLTLQVFSLHFVWKHPETMFLGGRDQVSHPCTTTYIFKRAHP
jgi:hypothetical protein